MSVRGPVLGHTITPTVCSATGTGTVGEHGLSVIHATESRLKYSCNKVSGPPTLGPLAGVAAVV